MKVRPSAALWLGFLAMSSCLPNRIEGTTLDVQGEALPGVAVTVEGAGYQAVTNTRGRYAVRYKPGVVVLSFVKAGYTPGRLELNIERYRPVRATPVRLWPLPPQKGVYFYENNRYRSTAPIEPERFQGTDGGLTYGTRRWADVETDSATPLILCHKMPRHGVRVRRMDLSELTVLEPEGRTETVEVWSPSDLIPVEPAPIDQFGWLLVELRFARPLEFGSYSVDWGALDGDPTRDARMFFFSVVNVGLAGTDPAVTVAERGH